MEKTKIKTYDVHIRLTPQLYEEVSMYCKIYNCSISSVVRKLLLDLVYSSDIY